ncbi:MAG: CPBP family intramembrane metalloprotease [Acidobacteria bacterium]|nr:CPBP family intramembrane metalloprotease [Acidobacteriota bacterium]
MFPERRRALLEVLVCSGYPTQLVLALVLRLAGVIPIDDSGRLSASFVFALSMLDAIVLMSLVLYFLRRSGQSPTALFLGSRSVPRELGLGVLLLPLTFGLVFGLLGLVHAVAPDLRNVPQNPLEALLATRAGFIALIAVALVAGGLREELQRAFLLHRFEHHLGGRTIGLVVTSVGFGLGHTLQGWDAAIATGALGFLWGALYMARRSTVAPIVNHALFNGTELIGAFARLQSMADV